MKKKIMSMMLAGSILLGLTACSNYEPLISSDGITSGSAVSGNSVTSVVSGGAVESNSENRQDNGNGGDSGKVKTGLPWSQWYRNCNSTKMYYTSYQDGDDGNHVVQVDLNGKEKKKVLNTKANKVLWVTDEWIYINVESKIYRIPVKRGEDRQETLDTSNKECIISDICEGIYDMGFYAMDDNDIYYLNKDEKIIACHIPDGSKREISVPSATDSFRLADGYVTDGEVFLQSVDSLYCIHRDTLAVEKIDSLSREYDDYGDNLVYMEESGELYFTRITDDFYGVCDTELCVYDGNTTRCVVTRKEMNDVLCKTWNVSKTYSSYFESFNIYSYDEKIYIEYMIDNDEGDDNCGVLVYDRNGKLYEEEKLAKQVKKHFIKKYNYYYDVYDIQRGKMYIADTIDDGGMIRCVYDLKTGEMQKVSVRTIRFMEVCTDYPKNGFIF